MWVTDNTDAGLGASIYFTLMADNLADCKVICGVVVHVADPLRLVELPPGYQLGEVLLIRTRNYSDNVIAHPRAIVTKETSTWPSAEPSLLQRLLRTAMHFVSGRFRR